MSSTIVQKLQEISDRLRSYEIGHNTAAHDYCNSLPYSQREAYIEKYETFFHIVSSTAQITDDLLFMAQKLDAIGDEYRSYVATNKKNPPPEFYSNGSYQEVARYFRAFCNNIAMLVKLLEENDLLAFGDFTKDYPEIQYVRLIRNAFVQHPHFLSPTDSINASSIPGDVSLVPYTHIAPGGGGFTFITSFYETLITDQAFQQLSPQEKLRSNKQFFLSGDKWSKICADLQQKELKAKIKCYGLPVPNQVELAQEFKRLFDSVVFPFIENKIVEAKQDSILFD